MVSECLDHAMPAQIVVQVLDGHPMEPSPSFFQPQMVGVRFLDVVDASQYLALASLKYKHNLLDLL